MLKRLIAATAAIALIATPVIATGAPTANARIDTTAVAPATERVEGMQANGRRNLALILAALVATGVGLYFAFQKHDNPPASP